MLHGGLVRASLTKEPSDARLRLSAHFADVNVADFTSRLGAASPVSGLARGQIDASFVIGDMVSRFIRRIESATWQIQFGGRPSEAEPKMMPLRLNTPELAAALREMQEDAERL